MTWTGFYTLDLKCDECRACVSAKASFTAGDASSACYSARQAGWIIEGRLVSGTVEGVDQFKNRAICPSCARVTLREGACK